MLEDQKNINQYKWVVSPSGQRGQLKMNLKVNSQVNGILRIWDPRICMSQFGHGSWFVLNVICLVYLARLELGYSKALASSDRAFSRKTRFSDGYDIYG